MCLLKLATSQVHMRIHDIVSMAARIAIILFNPAQNGAHFLTLLEETEEL